MTTERDFHRDLRALLRGVWQSRGDIDSADDIYGLYADQQEGTELLFNQRELDRFLDGLAGFAAVRIRVQEDDWPDLAAARTRYANESHRLWHTFYHFEGTTEGICRRVYVHVANPYIDNVMTIVQRLLNAMPTIGGFRKFKIAGPGGVSRRDQIIVYLSDEQSQTAVVRTLRGPRGLVSVRCADGGEGGVAGRRDRG